MLASHQIEDNGLRIIEEEPDTPTNLRIAVADLDVEGAYPNNEVVLNVSKETTVKELVSVQGLTEEVVRSQTINFCGGKANAVEWCTTMYGMPTLDKLLEQFNQDRTVEN